MRHSEYEDWQFRHYKEIASVGRLVFKSLQLGHIYIEIIAM